MTVIILFGMILLAYARTRATPASRPNVFHHLHGWQRLFGIVAFMMAMLIIMNPEFLALGFIGDTAFFDALVLFLTLQLQSSVGQVWRRIHRAFAETIRVTVPRNRMSHAYMVLALESFIESVSLFCKRVTRQIG